MTFDRTRDILEHCRKLHRGARERFGAMLDVSKDERTRMFLEHVIARECERERSLERAFASLPANVLDRYFQYQPKEHALDALDLSDESDPSLDSIVEAATEFLGEIYRFYSWLGEHAAPGEGQNLFTELATFTDQDRRDLARSAQELADT